MAKGAKKRAAKKSPIQDNSAAMRAHTRALDRHSKALEVVLASNVASSFALPMAGHRHFSKPQINVTLCRITGNPSLDPGQTFGQLLAGDAGIGKDITDQINHGFGPPPLQLTYKQIAGLKISELINLIYGSL
jgi:hypothetical protein